jgi:glycosyltransferase involved in cell wall biosynthesis
VIEALIEKFNYQVILVYWDSQRLTPFMFENNQDFVSIPRSEITNIQDCKKLIDFNPHLIWTSGRMDKLYLELNLFFKKNKLEVLRVMGCDNQWFGTFKDQLKAVLGYFLYRRYFDYCWVPGKTQKEFALKVGFPKNRILDNILSCTDSWFEHTSPLGENRILYVGRFAENKNLDLLVQIFLGLPEAYLSKWKLRLVGSGIPPQAALNHSSIEIFAFESQERLIQHGLQSSVFCLPSKHEPYGVVVHEFAALGLPLLLSQKVGAKDRFLQDNENGFSFDPLNRDDFSNKLKKMIELDDAQKSAFGSKSKELAAKLTPEVAAASLDAIVNQ